ncbi:MAG: hypothetical protein RR891_02660 [Clostridium sp.]
MKKIKMVFIIILGISIIIEFKYKMYDALSTSFVIIALLNIERRIIKLEINKKGDGS